MGMTEPRTKLGVVVATADATEVGRISRSLQEQISLTTPLTRQFARFGRTLLKLIVILATITFVMGLVRGHRAEAMFDGAVALAVVGFNWGGWMTSSKAEAAASTRADTAVVEALAPVCVAKFRGDAAVDANLVALKKVDSWSQGDFIEKGGWASVVDSKATVQISSVAKACGDILTKS